MKKINSCSLKSNLEIYFMTILYCRVRYYCSGCNTEELSQFNKYFLKQLSFNNA